MKSRVVKLGLCIIFLISLVACAFAFVRPIYIGLGNVMREKITELNSTLEKQFGLRVSYKKLSPSILTGININGIVVSDSFTEENILSVKKISVRYSLLQIISGDLNNSIKNIEIHDVYAEYINDKNTFWLTTILENKSEPEEIKNEKKSILEMLENYEISINLPCNVNIYNLTLKYKNTVKKIEAAAELRKISLEKTIVKGKYYVNLIGKVEGRIQKNTFSSAVYFKGQVLENIDNSSFVIQFFNTRFNSYSISQIGFLSEYDNLEYRFKMLPTVQDFYIELIADLNKKNISCRFDTDNFKVSDVVRGIKKGSVIDTIAALNLSVSAKLDCDYETKKIKYSSSGDIGISKEIVPGELSVSYAINGNEKYVNIPYVKALGQMFDFSFEGGYNIKSVQPNGVLSVNKIQLANEGIIQTEFFFEPLENGFMAFSPEIRFDEKRFTAAQLNFYPVRDGFDFDFDVYDYSHAENAEAGIFRLNATYQKLSKFFQSSVSIDNFYVDSILESAAFFFNKNSAGLLKDISKIFKNTVISTDAYISSYNGNFSYSVPNTIIADTKSDDKMLVFALDGNKDTLQLTKFELVYNDQKVTASAHSENINEPGTKNHQILISGNLGYNSIPYNFSGLINKDFIEFSGDYGFNFSLITDTDTDNLLGSFSLLDFPVKLSKSTLSITTDTTFYYNLTDRMNVNVNKFTLASIDGISDINPTFAFVGNADKTGVFLESIGYTDSLSSLTGGGSVIWNFNDADFINASYDISLSEPVYNESITIKGDITNPERKTFSSKNFLDDFYISSSINVSGFRTNRFFEDASMTDTINADISVTGALSNPLVSFSIPRGTFSINRTPFVFSVQASVVDREFEIGAANIEWGETVINNVVCKFSFNDWNGLFSCNAQTVVMDKSLIAPLTVRVEGIKSDERELIPGTFNIDITTPSLTGSFIKSQQPLAVHILKMPEETIISSSENIGLAGSILSNGEMMLKLENQIPCKFKISGNIKSRNTNISVYDIDVDLPKTLKLIDFSLLKIQNGRLTGNFGLAGAGESKGLYGQLQITPVEFYMPEFFRAHAKTDVVFINMEKDLIYIPETRCLLKRSPVNVLVNIQLNNMSFESLSVIVRTEGDVYAPVNINLNQVHVKGNFQTDLDITYEGNFVSVSGNLVAKDTTAEFGASRINEVVTGFIPRTEKANKLEVQVMLNVTMKKRVQVFYSSFLRGLVVPDTNVTFAYNSTDDKMLLDGDVPLRSGEIIYLNTSFYIKEGRVVFSDKDDGFDPLVSIRAETRERDSSNNDVTITLSCENQKLSQLSPKLTSSPAKSEKEIMELLGNIVTGNSENMASFMLATGDYAIQMMVMRKVENALRDFLNFDILSIRTQVVQNILKQSLSRSSDNQGINISNFFDNTSVYIGKYLSNSLYADAMLRLSYNKNRVSDTSTLQGLIFQPEIGLELESPIMRIRWSLAPDLSDISRNKMVFIPSLTLSWKFNY